MKERLKTTMGNVVFSLKVSFLASKKYFLLKCLILLSNTAIPVVSIWIWKNILNGVMDRREWTYLAAQLIFYFIMNLTGRIMGALNTYIERRYKEATEFYFEKVMLEKTARMDYSLFASSAMADRISRAQNNSWMMEETAWTVFSLLSEILNVGISFIILCRVNWWIALLTVIFMLPSAVHYRRYMDSLISEDYALSPDMRKIEYFTELFLDEQAHFEMKLNRTGTYFLDYFMKLKNKVLKTNTKLDVKHNMKKSLLSFLNYAGDALMLLASVWDVLQERIGIGDFQYNVSIISRLREQFTTFIQDGNRFVNFNEYLSDMREFIAAEQEQEKGGAKIPAANPKIEFCNVYFRYPNTDQDVLKDCSFVIEPHEKISLVGLNGAGKSTVIWLMFRFYDPQKGCIKIDGADIKEYDIYALRNVFGVLFQDVIPYSLPLREAIALSDFKERFNEKKLDYACAVSGAKSIVKDWEDGYDSVLGRRYVRNGKDLSGGQWQILGLARAYFRDRKYMVLDEPSAALDPVSEDRIFRQLYLLSEGRSLVAISHRLSNTIGADRILVLKDGRIIEQGPHHALLKQGGEYARLFHLQADKYS